MPGGAAVLFHPQILRRSLNYYRMRNIQSDTDMRQSISDSGRDDETPAQE